MADNNFQSKVESLFKGMDGYIHSKTVVGEAITVGDTIILPLIDVSFGVAAGALEGQENARRKNNGGGGMGCKMTPSAVLVIQNGVTKLVNVKNQDGLTKVLDMVPDFVNRFAASTGFAAGGGTSETATTMAQSADVNTDADTSHGGLFV